MTVSAKDMQNVANAIKFEVYKVCVKFNEGTTLNDVDWYKKAKRKNWKSGFSLLMGGDSWDQMLVEAYEEYREQNPSIPQKDIDDLVAIVDAYPEWYAQMFRDLMDVYINFCQNSLMK